MEIDQLGRVRDILEAARLIATYVQNTTETDFYADKQKQDAVIRRIEIIGFRLDPCAWQSQEEINPLTRLTTSAEP